MLKENGVNYQMRIVILKMVLTMHDIGHIITINGLLLDN